MRNRRHNDAYIMAGLLLVAFTMRGPTTGVGPLVPFIRESLNLSSGVSGMLTTIPLLLFAAVSPLAGKLSRVLRTKAQVLLCLGSISGGILVRSYLGLWGLFAGTALLGFGIGTLNVIMPAFIKARFPQRIGFMMGLYSSCMTAFSALASGTAVWLCGALAGWQNALGIYAVIPLLAIVAWLPLKGTQNEAEERNAISLRKLMGDKTNWFIALFMGSQSFLFFTFTAWLPSILLEKGLAAEEASLLMMTLQLASIITKFLVPMAAQKFRAHRAAIATLPGLTYALGYLVVLTGAGSSFQLWAGGIIIGLAAGMSMTLSLTLVALKGQGHEETTQLSAFSQTVGYTLAAFGPMAIGAMVDAGGSFTLPIYLIMLVGIFMSFVGNRAGNGLAKSG